jgi:hypothetical protein
VPLEDELVVVGDGELELLGARGWPYCPNATGREKSREMIIRSMVLLKLVGTTENFRSNPQGLTIVTERAEDPKPREAFERSKRMGDMRGFISS